MGFKLPKTHTAYYDPVTFKMTPALYRVRKPFFWRNTVALFAVSAVPLAVYLYTWKKLDTDDFGDIPIPPLSESEIAELKKEYEEKKKLEG